MRQGIFPKAKGARYQGIVGEEGKLEFERARQRLKRMAKWKGRVSDGDVFEALGRGWDNVAEFLKKKRSAA